MKTTLLAISTALLLASCSQSGTTETETATDNATETASYPSSKEVADFYEDWLKEHDVKNIKRSGNAVILPDANVKLEGGIQPNREGGVSTVEMEAKITLPDGREIIDYPAGIGDDTAKATGDALANFTLTTFHPLYAAFVDPKDPHTDKQKWKIGSAERTVYVGEPGLRGKVLPATKSWIIEKFKNSFATQKLDDKAHWSKLVIAEADGKIVEFEITVDNETDKAMQAAMMNDSNPPGQDDFYMVKQFIVIAPLAKQ